jgi:crotonobetainyl-CoA:carnitine CoA-transferase CaiB-like acyl-CoA transferase
MLSAYQVLDISDAKGTVCSQVLAWLGANVIKIERPGGSPERDIGPFCNDVEDPEMGLLWLSFNRGKKSITLDITDSEGKEIFKNLVKKSDILIESFDPGYLESIGLSYETLSKINPKIILVSISPFGQEGPYRDYVGSDLAITALSGYMYLCGDEDRAPVRVSYPLSSSFASVEGAVGCLIAVYARENTGKGQHVEVSIHESMSRFSLMAPPFWEMEKRILKRTGQFRSELSSLVKERIIFRCKDGFVSFAIYGGQMGARINKALAGWMDSENMADDFFTEFDWDNLDMKSLSQEDLSHLEDVIQQFFMTHTKNELYDGAIKRGINLGPVWNAEDMLRSKQLNSRNFWVKIDHPKFDRSITYPGDFYKSSEVPCHSKGRSPLIGEHNNEILRDMLNISDMKIKELKEKNII